MEISFIEDKVGNLNDFKACEKQWGSQVAKLIARRLNEVRAVLTLSELLRPGFPGKWHALKGDRKGQFASNLKGPYRLICVPDGDPEKYMESDNINAHKVVAVIVVEIGDYH